MNVKRLARGPILWVVIAVILLYIGASTLAAPKISKIDTSDGITLLADGKVDQAKITEGVQRVDLTLKADFEKDDKNLGK